MKIKKIVLSLLLVGMVGGLAYAGQPKFKIPKDVDAVKDLHGAFSGVETVKLVTSTTPALVTDSNSVTITDGLIHWAVLGSTTDVTSGGGLYLELRSTNTANVTTARLIPNLVVTENDSGVSYENQFIQFRPPIPFSNGLSVNLAPIATTPGSIEFAIGVGWKKE